jgi:polyisoprenoid-binding protein YceI
MKSKAILTVASLVLAGSVFAAPKTFRIVSSENAKSIGTVESVTAVETIIGKGPVTGSITFDPAKGTGSGSLAISVKGIDTGIPTRNDHMVSEGWLDAAKYPEITFKAKKVQKTGKDSYRVSGDFSLHGVTKSITADVTLKHVPASAQSKGLGFKGDVVQLSTKFTIKLSDYNVKISGPATGKVNNEVTISVAAFGDSK